MRTMLWTVSIASCLLSGSIARADQCEWVEPRVAVRAARLLADQPNIVELCEPCGDTVPTAPVTAKDLTVKPVDGGLSTVVVGGRSIDLAYLYVEQDGRYRNVAGLAGCAASGVSPVINLGEIPAIEPPEATTAEATVPTVTVVPSREPSPEPPPTPDMYFISMPLSPWWFVLAGGAGAIGGTLLTLLAFARFRRRGLLPRATNL